MTASQDEPRSGGFLAIGVILAVLASMSGTAGKQTLRFSELQGRKGTPASKCVGKVAFITGLLLNIIIGPLIDMGSYAFAPQSLIAPLGGLDVVWNTLTAPFTLGETLTVRLFCGCVVITAGAIVTSLTGSHDSGEFTVDTIQGILVRPTVLVYLLAFGAWLLFNVLVLMPRSAAPKGQPWKSGDRLRGLSLGMTAGSISGNMFCVKAFVEVVEDSISRRTGEAWLTWLPYGLFAGALFFAFSNLYFLTKAMREYEALFMGAVFEGSLIISACLSGVVVFSEMERLRPWQMVLFWAAILSLVGGIYVVCTGSAKPPPAEAAQDVAAAEEHAGDEEEPAEEEPAEVKKAAGKEEQQQQQQQVDARDIESVMACGEMDATENEDSLFPPPADVLKTGNAASSSRQVTHLICTCGKHDKAGGSSCSGGKLAKQPVSFGVVPSSPPHVQGIHSHSCSCGDGVSCFCGMSFLGPISRASLTTICANRSCGRRQ